MMITPDTGEALGIDVSHYQGEIDWSQVVEAGYKYAFCKATQMGRYVGGSWQVDPTFQANYQGALDAGMHAGAYLFFMEEYPGEAQGSLFCDYIESTVGTLPVMMWIDVERSGGISNAIAQDRLQECVMTIINRANGIRPGIYTSASRWQQLIEIYSAEPAWATQVPLWVAHYTARDYPYMPDGWLNWRFWQFTRQGQVPGINGAVDINRFNGNAADLATWLKFKINSDRWIP